jgi:hypothetical protein
LEWLSYELRFGMRAPLSFTVTRLDSTDSTEASLGVQVEEGATTTVQSPNARETHAGKNRVIPLLKKKDPRHPPTSSHDFRNLKVLLKDI